MKEIIIDESYAGKRLDRFLISYFKFCSKNLLFKLIRLKKIKVNDHKVDQKYLLKKGDKIKFYISDLLYKNMLQGDEVKEKEKTDQINDFFLLVIYEDEAVIIVQKPVDMVVIEDEKEKKWVLTDFVRYYCDKNYSGKSKKIEENDNNENEESSFAKFNVSPVHRLDRNTTGLVIFAKTYEAFNDLTDFIKKRKIEKEYLAIASGEILLKKRIELNIVKDEEKNLVTVRKESKNNENDYQYNLKNQNLSEKIKTAITIITPIINTKDATLIHAIIETGRTHQIRVTLANSGHPIIMDTKYGKKKDFEEFVKKYSVPSILLLAYSLQFPDNLPPSIKNLEGKRIEAILPDFWVNILDNHFDISKNKLEELLKKIRK